jgi:hypothetical protein
LLYYKDARVHCEVLNIRAAPDIKPEGSPTWPARKPDPNPHRQSRRRP